MEDVESNLRSSQGSQNGLESFAKLAVNVEGFKKLIKETLEENAKITDHTKSYLKESSNELLRRFRDQEALLNTRRGKVIMPQKQVGEDLPELEKKVQNLEREIAILKLDHQQKVSDMESQLRDQTCLLDQKNEEVKRLQKIAYDLNLSNSKLNSTINDMGVNLRIYNELNTKLNEYMSEMALEKLDDQALHESQLRDQTSLYDKKNEEVVKLQKMVDDLNLSNSNLNSMIKNMGVDLRVYKELNTKMDEYISEMELEKLTNQALHEHEISELNKKINDLLSQDPKSVSC